MDMAPASVSRHADAQVAAFCALLPHVCGIKTGALDAKVFVKLDEGAWEENLDGGVAVGLRG
jgi:hypothetical protein